MRCPKCKSNTVELVSDAHPEASEFYCPKCNESYQMSPEDYAALRGGGRLRGPSALRSG